RELAVSAKERLLREHESALAVAHDRRREREDASAVAVDEPDERLALAPTGGEDELVVFRVQPPSPRAEDRSREAPAQGLALFSPLFRTDTTTASPLACFQGIGAACFS